MTTMTDDELVAKVKAYIAAHPNAFRSELKRKLGTSTERLEKLSKAGHFELPKALNRSIASTLNRKRNNLMAGWTINRRH